MPDQPILRDVGGTVLASRPVDVLGPVEVFSQHELAELAESPDYVAELLRRFDLALPSGQASLRDRLRRNRGDIVAALRDMEELDEQLAELPRQREALARYEAEGLATRLAEQVEIDRREIIQATARSLWVPQTVSPALTSISPWACAHRHLPHASPAESPTVAFGQST